MRSAVQLLLLVVWSFVFAGANPPPVGTPDCAWVEFNKDPGQTGFTTLVTNTPDNNNRAWTVNTGAPIYGSPITIHGSVFVVDYSGMVYAIELATGYIQWTLPIALRSGGVTSTPSYHAGMLHFISEDGVFHAINTAAMMEIYTYDTNTVFNLAPFSSTGDWSSPTADNGYIYFVSKAGFVVAIDPFTETHIWWMSNYIGGSPNIGMSDAIGGSLVYSGVNHMPGAPTAHGTVVAFAKLTGAPAWTYDYKTIHGVNGFISPRQGIVVADAVPPFGNHRELYFVVGGGANALVVLNAEIGNELWTRSFGSEVSLSTPLIFEGKLFVGTQNGNIYAFNPQTHALLWVYGFGAGNPIGNSLVGAEGKIFGSAGATNFALDINTHTLVWTDFAGLESNAPAIACDGKVIYTTENNLVIAYGTIPCENGHTCYTYVLGDCSTNPSCACSLTTEGDNVCTTHTFCAGLTACTHSSQCPRGSHCIASTCCPEGEPSPNVCLVDCAANQPAVRDAEANASPSASARRWFSGGFLSAK